MKILFLNPPFDGIKGPGGKVAPINLGYLAAYLLKHRPEIDVSILDAEGLDWSVAETIKYIREVRPDVLAATCPTAAVPSVAAVFGGVRDCVPVRVVGGPHPTALPAETLDETGATVAVVGEGELAMLDMVVDGTFSAGIRKHPRVENLDDIPFPARHLLPQNLYEVSVAKGGRRGSRPANVVTTRGCPYRCAYCSTHVSWPGRIRRRSVENIVAELRQLVSDGVNEITFHDDVFTIPKGRVRELCLAIIDERFEETIPEGLVWNAQSRAGSVDDVTLTLMYRAGCRRLTFGFESGSDYVLRLMNKQNDIQTARETILRCRRAGISTFGGFILGYPGETRETIRETVAFACRCGVDVAGFSFPVPYPGTDLYEQAKREGLIPAGLSWNRFAHGGAEPVMDIPGLSRDELISEHRLAYRKFYLRPSRVLFFLKRPNKAKIQKGLKLFAKLALSKRQDPGRGTGARAEGIGGRQRG